MALKKDKDFQNGIDLICPKEIYDRIDFAKEAKRLNKEKRLARKITTEALRINFVMVVNFLSNTIPSNDSPFDFAQLHKEFIKKKCSDKYYRICIEMLKRERFLYIRTYDGKTETYMAGVVTKQYRWNKSSRQLGDMRDYITVKVHHPKIKKKIIENIEYLQCFHYLKEHMTKTTRKISKFKKPRGLKSGNLNTMNKYMKYESFLRNWYEIPIYITKEKEKYYENCKKYPIQKYLCDNFGIVFRLNYYKELSLQKIKQIKREIEDEVYNLKGVYASKNNVLSIMRDGIEKKMAYCDDSNYMFAY